MSSYALGLIDVNDWKDGEMPSIPGMEMTSWNSANQSTPKSCIEFLLNSSLCACALKHQEEYRHMDLPSLTTGIGFRAATFDSGLLLESPYTMDKYGVGNLFPETHWRTHRTHVSLKARSRQCNNTRTRTQVESEIRYQSGARFLILGRKHSFSVPSPYSLFKSSITRLMCAFLSILGLWTSAFF